MPDRPASPEPDRDPDAGDADLIAYLDGELDEPEARAVEGKVGRDPDTRARAEAYRRTFDLLDYLPRPDPAPDFTARTLTKLHTGPDVTAPTVASGSALVPASSPVAPAWLTRAAWVVGCAVALGGGYLAHASFRSSGFVAPPDTDELDLSYLRVIEHLPLYLGVDDLDFVRRLDANGLFAPEPASAGGGPPPGPSAGVREKLIAEFKRFPAARQQQLRQLDQQLADLPPADRDRLFGVLEAYSSWLDRLPGPDRREVLSAADPAERLDAVRRVGERAWRDALPARSREQFTQTADPDERFRLVSRWKQAEANRRAEWALARRQWGEQVRDPGARLWPFSDPVLAGQVDEYVRTVLGVDPAIRVEPKMELPAGCRLTRDELFELKARHEAAQKDGYWLLYGACLQRFAERHPGLPEPGSKSAITDSTGLPPVVVRDLRKAKIPPEVRKAHVVGKWPDYALEVTQAAQKVGLVLAEPLGPCRPGEFRPPVSAFVSDALLPVLTPAEREKLKALEGKWPDYPRQMVESARRHDLSVPGVTLPGPPSLWAKFYTPGPP